MNDRPGLRLVAIDAGRPGRVTLDGVEQATITAALAAAVPGSVITLGRGRYRGATESFPLRIPDGVTLTGPEPRPIPEEAKKFLPTPPPAELVAAGEVVHVVGDRARLAHLELRTLDAQGPAARIEGTRGVVLDTVGISGGLRVHEAEDTRLEWLDVRHGGIDATAVRALRIVGGTVTGSPAVPVAVRFADAEGVRIEATALPDADTGILVERCRQVLVGGCAVLAASDAVGVCDSHEVAVNGNRLRGTRAVHLARCGGVELSANGVEWAHTAFEIRDCTGVELGFNHVAEARHRVVRSDTDG